MALPTLEKTYSFRHWNDVTTGTGDNDNRNLFMNWKDEMVAAGWTVVGSSGNGNYALDGTDYWTDYSYLATGRWIVLENTSISSHFQICLQMTSATEASDLYVSASGDYSNSTTEDETTRPSADDEFTLNGNFMNLSGTGGVRRVDIVYSTDKTLWYIFASCNGSYQGVLAYFGVPKNPHTSWTDGWLTYQRAVTIDKLADNSDFDCVCGDVTKICAIAEGTGVGGWLVENTRYQTVDSDGDWFLQPVNFLWSSDRDSPGFWGELYDFYVATPSLASGTQLPSTGATTFIKIDDLVIPWDDTAWP